MRRRRGAGAVDTSTIDKAQARAQLALFLAGAESLDWVTVDFLARIYRLPAKELECALVVAKQKRAAHG